MKITSKLVRGKYARQFVFTVALLFLSVTSICGQTFVTQTNVNTTGSGRQSETSIAINPKNPNNIIAGANRNSGVAQAVMVSTDGGVNWTLSSLPLTDSKGNTFSLSSDPRVAFDSNGNAFFAYILFNSTSGTFTSNPTPVANALVVAKSTDEGATWSSPVPIVVNLIEPFPLEDRHAIAIDPNSGNIYVSWTHFYKAPLIRESLGGSVFYSRSIDGGESFDTPQTLTPFAPDSVQYSMPAVAPNGDVYVVWASWITHQIMISRSIDHGRHFSPPVVVGQFMRIAQPRYTIPAQPNRGVGPAPAIACGTDNTIYVAWPDLADGAEPGSADIDIYVRKSVNDGLGWDTLGINRKRVNNDGPGASQFNVSMAIDSADNTINIAYYDTRQDPANGLTNLFVSRSTDGGHSFTDIRASTAPSNETGPSGNLGNDYGDYTGIAARNGVVFPAWTDSRTGQENIFVARMAECRSPATIPVVNTTDVGSDPPGSLRHALLIANRCANIVFNIPKSDAGFSAGDGAFTIQVTSPLPPINGTQITLDGETENAFMNGNPNPLGGPSIVVSGSLITGGTIGLTVGAPASQVTINKLSIVGFAVEGGIDVSGANTTITNNWIGIGPAAIVLGNELGLRLRVGANQANVRSNVISGNKTDGLIIGSNENRILSNRIGTNPNGTAALPNGNNGILLTGKQNEIGSNDSGQFGSNVISGNGAHGISIRGGEGNVVAANRIGTDLNGTAAIPNLGSGIFFDGGATANSVGTTKTGGGGANLISGNAGHGIVIHGKSHGNEIAGNYIGVSTFGGTSLSNFGNGILLRDEARNNTIGRAGEAATNTISGNRLNGIVLEGRHTMGNVIRGNLIGVGSDRVSGVPNRLNGILLDNGAQQNQIGEAGVANVIAFNLEDGIRMQSGVDNTERNRISANSIFQNGRLGINLAGGAEDANGITSNDERDPDTGANGLQNYPSLHVARDGQSVDASVTTRPSTTYLIELFSNAQADPSGAGEGQVQVAKRTVTTDADGNAAVRIAIPTDHRGKPITATLTDGDGNTSEFSRYSMASAQRRSVFVRAWFSILRFFGFRRSSKP